MVGSYYIKLLSCGGMLGQSIYLKEDGLIGPLNLSSLDHFRLLIYRFV